MTIAVCAKWVDLRPEIDPTTGRVTTDVRRRGFSDADQAALETALVLAAERSTGVTLVSLAPAAAEPALRELAASGAASIIRIDGDGDGAESSRVGTALAAAIGGDVDLVIGGAYSLDRGTGSVPAYIAHERGWSQALGLIGVHSAGGLTAVRRLDGGRREHVRIAGPAVLSVEGSVAHLRRASMRQVLASRDLPLTVVPFVGSTDRVIVERTEPLRPRARSLPAPHGARALQRIVELTGALVERTPPRRVEAEPAAAAAEIVAQLGRWGYLD